MWYSRWTGEACHVVWQVDRWGLSCGIAGGQVGPVMWYGRWTGGACHVVWQVDRWGLSCGMGGGQVGPVMWYGRWTLDRWGPVMWYDRWTLDRSLHSFIQKGGPLRLYF